MEEKEVQEVKPVRSKGRPKGGHNRPGTKKTGRKLGRSSIAQMPAEAVLDYKYKILDVINRGLARTISEAARKVGVTPVQAYNWADNDIEFKEAIRQVREVIADELEEKLRNHANFIPLMFILKGYRPMFRDNYKIDIGSSKLEELLGELKNLSEREISIEQPSQVVDVEVVEIPMVTETK